MDLLSSIRKEGSRGGVNFSWSDVTTSSHRENYLGHSLMAPVGRWQKNKDLSWYAKGDNKEGADGETADERRIRERKEEIRRIKDAEEDALARALGLPVKDRSDSGGNASGANNIEVGEMKRLIKETEEGDDEIEEVGKSKGFGEFVGKVEDSERMEGMNEGPVSGGLLRRGGEEKKKKRGDRSRSRERRHHRHHHRDRSREHRHRDGGDRHREKRHRSRSPERARRRSSRSPDVTERRHRSRSGERMRGRRDDREGRERIERRRSREPRTRRSRSREPVENERERRRD